MNAYRVPLPVWAYIIIGILMASTIGWLASNWDGTLGKRREQREACRTVYDENTQTSRIVCSFSDGTGYERPLLPDEPGAAPAPSPRP